MVEPNGQVWSSFVILDKRQRWNGRLEGGTGEKKPEPTLPDGLFCAWGSETEGERENYGNIRMKQKCSISVVVKGKTLLKLTCTMPHCFLLFWFVSFVTVMGRKGRHHPERPQDVGRYYLAHFFRSLFNPNAINSSPRVCIKTYPRCLNMFVSSPTLATIFYNKICFRAMYIV